MLAAGALAVVVVAVLSVVLVESGSGGRHGAETGVPAGDTTASVTRRTLSESSTVDGTLGYGTTLELYDRVGGTFTWLPSVGAVIGRGGTLWRIDDLPIVLMYGSVPAYRTLKQGVGDGPDVTELNENLIDLGFDPYGAITDDESFSAATADAVKRWQKAHGLSQTGVVELGRVVFAPGARRVTAVKVALGQDPPGATAPTRQDDRPQHPARRGEQTRRWQIASEKTGRPNRLATTKARQRKDKEKPAKQNPAKEAPAKEEPAKESPPKKNRRKKTPAKNRPAEGRARAPVRSC